MPFVKSSYHLILLELDVSPIVINDGKAPIAARSLKAIAIERYATSSAAKFFGKCVSIFDISTECTKFFSLVSRTAASSPEPTTTIPSASDLFIRCLKVFNIFFSDIKKDIFQTGRWLPCLHQHT